MDSGLVSLGSNPNSPVSQVSEYAILMTRGLFKTLLANPVLSYACLFRDLDGNKFN